MAGSFGDGRLPNAKTSSKEQALFASMRVADGKVQEFLDAWKERADNAFKNEPGTLAYGVMQNMDDPNEMMVIERYKDNDAAQAHFKNPAEGEMGKKMAKNKLTAGRVFEGFGTDFGPGFWGRDTTPGEKGSFVMLLHFQCSKGSPKDFFDKWQEECAHVQGNEPNTLSYQAMTIRKFNNGGNQPTKGFETGGKDFVIFEQYKDEKDLEVHSASEPFKNFNKSLSPKRSEVVVAPKFQKKYKFTGVGFVSRPGQSKM